MNRLVYQQKALVGGCVTDGVICPKPRRIGGLPRHFHDLVKTHSRLLQIKNPPTDVYDARAGTVLLDIIHSKEITSSSSKHRTRTTAHMSVISVLDKDAIIKNLQASLAQERKNNSELVEDLNILLTAKHDLEEHREHLQEDVQRFAHYYDKSKKDHEAIKELLAASQAEVAELQAQREQISFMAVQRHHQDAATIQELHNFVQNLTLHNEQLLNEIHHLQDVLINVELEIEPIEEPMEHKAVEDGVIIED